MNSPKSVHLAALHQWAKSFDPPGATLSLSEGELNIVRKRVLQRLKQYKSKIEERYDVPSRDSKDGARTYRLWMDTVPYIVIRLHRRVDALLRQISDQGCPESAIVEVDSLDGLSGNQLESRLTAISLCIERQGPELQERRLLLGQIKRLIAIAEKDNCPESAIKEFLYLRNVETGKLCKAIEGKLVRYEASVLQTAEVIQRKTEENYTPLPESQSERKSRRGLNKKRDDWMNLHGLFTLSSESLADISSSELILVWNEGVNAFDDKDREVIRTTLRQRAGIEGIKAPERYVCPRCSLIGDACVCNRHS